jgi:hypothetical protein
MNLTWYSNSVFKDGLYSIKYRAPDGSTGQTLYYKTMGEAAVQFCEIKESWRDNERMKFLLSL